MFHGLELFGFGFTVLCHQDALGIAAFAWMGDLSESTTNYTWMGLNIHFRSSSKLTLTYRFFSCGLSLPYAINIVQASLTLSILKFNVCFVFSNILLYFSDLYTNVLALTLSCRTISGAFIFSWTVLKFFFCIILERMWTGSLYFSGLLAASFYLLACTSFFFILVYRCSNSCFFLLLTYIRFSTFILIIIQTTHIH